MTSPRWAVEAQSDLLERAVFTAEGLLPAIAQDAESGHVLMLAWMTREALDLTLTTGRATYFSRSRAELWTKGDTSGNTQHVVSARLDCDGDTVLLAVHQSGPACHRGSRSCFDADASHD
jgi:phosphoribosyl-AMP cyclohydrolase